MSISEKLHNNESEQTTASCSNMDKSYKHYVDNMKQNIKGYMLCDSTCCVILLTSWAKMGKTDLQHQKLRQQLPLTG